MAKKLVFNTPESQDVQAKLLAGIKQLADAVGVTLGPSGRVVMYEREFGDPAITKDGVTVAKQVELDDPLENMAAAMVRQAAAKTAAVAGDGTTTATVYAQAIFKAGLKGISSGADPQEVKRGIDHATKVVIDRLGEMAKPVAELEQIKQVAVCSANQDQEVGEMIASALDQVGKDGVVTIEEGRALRTTVSVIDGLQIPRGYMSPQFATDPETLACEYDEPYILMTDEKVADLKVLLTILKMVVEKLNNRPLVIIADEFSDACLTALVINRVKSQLQVVAVKAPGFGDRRQQILEDLAVATGGTFLTKDGIGLEQVNLSHLGTCERIKIDRDTTTILEGGGDDEKIEERVNLLRVQLEAVSGNFDKERVQERLACLTGGVAQILVGGATEVEVREKKDRIDDALHACKAAIEEGILPGGAVAAIHASKKPISTPRLSEDFKIGIDVLKKALEAPLRQIAINTGKDDGVIVSKVRESVDDINFGFNAVTNEYGDMIEAGIIVPAKVERVALLNAASVAGLLLTTDCMIAIDRSSQSDGAGPPTFPSLGM
jgi:chaperonin GroEL